MTESDRKELDRLWKYANWYEQTFIKPERETGDLISAEHDKRARDEILFRIAEVGAGVKIPAKVFGTATISFYGATRYRYSPMREIRAKSAK
jgi:hypothetical protein